MKLSHCAPLLAVSILLSVSALANSVNSMSASPDDITPIQMSNIYYLGNTGGIISFNATSQTLSLTSTFTSIKYGGSGYSGNLGTVTFTTGSMVSGSIYTSALFDGGTFTITSNGTDGLPNGVLLTGTFGVVHWHEVGHTNQYSFSARFSGSSQYIFDTGGTMNQESVLVSGTTQFNVGQGEAVIPEPGTWFLMGTGLFGICGAVRRKLRV